MGPMFVLAGIGVPENVTGVNHVVSYIHQVTKEHRMGPMLVLAGIGVPENVTGVKHVIRCYKTPDT